MHTTMALVKGHHLATDLCWTLTTGTVYMLAWPVVHVGVGQKGAVCRAMQGRNIRMDVVNTVPRGSIRICRAYSMKIKWSSARLADRAKMEGALTSVQQEAITNQIAENAPNILRFLICTLLNSEVDTMTQR